MLRSVSPCSNKEPPAETKARDPEEPDAEPSSSGAQPPAKKARKRRGKRRSLKLGVRERREQRQGVPGEQFSADYEDTPSDQDSETSEGPDRDAADTPAPPGEQSEEAKDESRLAHPRQPRHRHDVLAWGEHVSHSETASTDLCSS